MKTQKGILAVEGRKARVKAFQKYVEDNRKDKTESRIVTEQEYQKLYTRWKREQERT